ncbi:hypothetical protein NCLIV_003460 [Neospora caninum Liverpool]|nr:hypothetical protein NCLIV_003460 [Neospora caninum Liverpool]CBZ49861.1 hypothetical protein NCLIV_003460 [Neospora caninum Liverpool]|eukprot:XP_003879896.1 hypothetical protein NCLIV_003460 [Neospora caninum Liverpool]
MHSLNFAGILEGNPSRGVPEEAGPFSSRRHLSSQAHAPPNPGDTEKPSRTADPPCELELRARTPLSRLSSPKLLPKSFAGGLTNSSPGGLRPRVGASETTARGGTRLKATTGFAEDGQSVQVASAHTQTPLLRAGESSSSGLTFEDALSAGTAQLFHHRQNAIAAYIRQNYGSQATAFASIRGSAKSLPVEESVPESKGDGRHAVETAGANTLQFGALFAEVASDRHQMALLGARPQAQGGIVFSQQGAPGAVDPTGMATPDLDRLYTQYLKSSQDVARAEFGLRSLVESFASPTPRGSAKTTQSSPAPMCLPFPHGFFFSPRQGTAGIAPPTSQGVPGLTLKSPPQPSQPGRRVLQTAAVAQLAKTGVYRDLQVSQLKVGNLPVAASPRQQPTLSASSDQNAPRPGSQTARVARSPAVRYPWAFFAANQGDRAPTASSDPPRRLATDSADGKAPALHAHAATCEENDNAPLSHCASSNRSTAGAPPDARGVSAASSGSTMTASTRLSSHSSCAKSYIKANTGFSSARVAASKSTTPAPSTRLTTAARPAVSRPAVVAEKKNVVAIGVKDASTEDSVSMNVLRVSLCGKKTTLSHRGHLMASRVGGVLRPLNSRDTGVRLVEYKDHRELVFQLPSKELIPFKDIQIVAPISQGSFGTVSQAKWQGTTVAVKQAHGVLTQEALRSIAREMNSFRSMGTHPYIVRYIGMCLDPKCVGIVMEYLPGGSLFDLLYENKVLIAAERRLMLGRQLSQAVHYLHREKRLVHRDLKTANLIVDGTSGLKLCDFGKTRSLEASGKLLLDDNGGSPRYMAPECFAVGTLIDEKADIWGLACCLIEILGGPIPFEDIHSNDGVIDAIMCKRMRPVVPTWFHPAARRLLERCFSWSARDRPSALEIARTLELFCADDLNAYGMNTRRVK